jgi:YbbR domain-containing protein
VKPAFKDYVDVKAPQSVLDKVEKIVASISVKDAVMDVENASVPLKVIGEDGADYTDDVELSIEFISLKAKVYPKKIVPLRAVPEGDAADGYWISGITVEPPQIEIAGPESELAEIQEIVLKPVLMYAESESFEISRNVNDSLVGSSIVASSSSPAVDVAVSIEKEAFKDITIEMSNIAIIKDTETAEMEFQILNEDVTVSIRGPSVYLDQLDKTNIRAEADLSGMSKGIYDIPLHFEFPLPGITLVRQVLVRVVIGDDLNAAAIFTSPYEGALSAKDALGGSA